MYILVVTVLFTFIPAHFLTHNFTVLFQQAVVRVLWTFPSRAHVLCLLYSVCAISVKKIIK